MLCAKPLNFIRTENTLHLLFVLLDPWIKNKNDVKMMSLNKTAQILLFVHCNGAVHKLLNNISNASEVCCRCEFSNNEWRIATFSSKCRESLPSDFSFYRYSTCFLL